MKLTIRQYIKTNELKGSHISNIQSMDSTQSYNCHTFSYYSLVYIQIQTWLAWTIHTITILVLFQLCLFFLHYLIVIVNIHFIYVTYTIYLWGIKIIVCTKTKKINNFTCELCISRLDCWYHWETDGGVSKKLALTVRAQILICLYRPTEAVVITRLNKF